MPLCRKMHDPFQRERVSERERERERESERERSTSAHPQMLYFSTVGFYSDIAMCTSARLL